MAQQKVAEEEHKRMQILRRIQEYDHLINEAFRDQQQKLAQEALDPVQMQNFPNYVWRLKQSRFQDFQALQIQERKLQLVREALKQALIKKKSLDILKDKDHAKYRQQLEKAEEEFLAEIALTRSIRNSTTR